MNIKRKNLLIRAAKVAPLLLTLALVWIFPDFLKTTECKAIAVTGLFVCFYLLITLNEDLTLRGKALLGTVSGICLLVLGYAIYFPIFR
jgi:hypothetical protein